MILPLGDSPNSREIPFVTWALIALNVSVYALVSLPLSFTPVDPNDPAVREYLRAIAEATGEPVFVRETLQRMSAYDLYVFENGFRPGAPGLRQLFYSLFLHGGFAHLFGNMLFLWIYGDNVEHRLGRVSYLLSYLAAGVAATLFYSLFDRDSQLPLVGASGAISGVLGFYFLWFPHNSVRLLLFLFPFFTDVVRVRARWLLGFYLIVDNLFPFLLTAGNGRGGVAYGAHIGGFLAGVVLAKLLDRREVRGRRPQLVEEGGIETEGTVLADALREGRYAEAARIYFGLPAAATRRLLAPEDAIRLGEWLRRHGHAEAALVVFRRHLRDYPHGPLAAEAHLGAGLVQLEDMNQPAAAYQHLLDALDLDPHPETARTARAALERIAARQRQRLHL